MKNMSRRNMANWLVNKFINNKRLRIISINVSSIGNFEIKCYAPTVTTCDIKLRVNMNTRTYVFEFYAASHNTNIRNTQTKRKNLNTELDVNDDYIYDCLINELKAAELYGVATISKDKMNFEHYIGVWSNHNTDDSRANLDRKCCGTSALVNDIIDQAESLLNVGTRLGWMCCHDNKKDN